MSKNTNLSFLTDYITADITNGRIGINTPSPTVAFDVVGVAKFSDSVTATSASSLFKEGYIIQATTTSGGGSQPAYTYYTAAGSKRWASFLNVGDDKFHISNASNAEVFTITQTGKVAIGTTFTSSGLNINVAAGVADGLSLTDNTTVPAVFTYNTSTGENKIGGILSYVFPTFYSGGSERMRIATTGNVGIGTASPGSTLDVNGNFRIGSGTISAPGISFRNSTNSGFYLTDDGSGALINIGIGATNIATFKYNGTSTFSGSVTATSATFTGRIGTSLSSSGSNFNNSSLYVNNTASTKGAIFGYNDTADNFYFTVLQHGVAYKPLLINASAATFSSTVLATAFFVPQNEGIGFNGQGLFTTAIYSRNSGADLCFNAGNSEKMRITSGGNVGIGFSNPTRTLQVAGVIQGNNISQIDATGTGSPQSLGLNINAGSGGRVYLLSISAQWSDLLSTSADLYLIRCGYNGNLFTSTLVAGSHNLASFSQVGGILYITLPLNYAFHVQVLNNA